MDRTVRHQYLDYAESSKQQLCSLYACFAGVHTSNWYWHRGQLPARVDNKLCLVGEKLLCLVVRHHASPEHILRAESVGTIPDCPPSVVAAAAKQQTLYNQTGLSNCTCAYSAFLTQCGMFTHRAYELQSREPHMQLGSGPLHKK